MADAAFINLLHQSTKASGDRDYIRLICDSNCLRPDRSDFLTGRSNLSPRRSIIHSLKLLESVGANVIVMPCNTAHYWFPSLCRYKRTRTVIVNMLRQVSLRCYENGYRRVCLLATPGAYQKKLYFEPLFAMGVDMITPCSKIRNEVYRFICDVKSGKNPKISELEAYLHEIDCDAFIVGCTELSCSLLKTDSPTLRYVDSLSCLAMRVLEIFGKQRLDIPYV